MPYSSAKTQTPVQRTRHIAKPIFLTFALFILVVLGWLTTERYVGKARLANYEKALKSRGEQLAIADLLPVIPNASNGAVDVIRLCGTLQDGGLLPSGAPPPCMRLIAPGKAMRGAAQTEWLSRDGKSVLTNYWEELKAELAANETTLAQLRTALRSPVLYKRLNYEAGFRNLDMTHLMAFKRGAQWLAASGVNHLHHRHSARALDDIESLLALLRMQSHEHLTINQLVRWAIEYFAIALTWEALEAGEWDDQALKRIQDAWMELRFIEPVLGPSNIFSVKCVSLVWRFS